MRPLLFRQNKSLLRQGNDVLRLSLIGVDRGSRYGLGRTHCLVHRIGGEILLPCLCLLHGGIGVQHCNLQLRLLRVRQGTALGDCLHDTDHDTCRLAA